jgi:hypothetical protein
MADCDGWFVCPLSGRRARVLYLPGGAPMFASRQALGLGYRSQRSTEADRLIEKSRAARKKLGIGSKQPSRRS